MSKCIAKTHLFVRCVNEALDKEPLLKGEAQYI
jgi:hypothetical protein